MKVTKTIRLEDLGLELALIPQSLEEAADLCLQLPRMVTFAKAFCPVQTGALKDSVRVERPGALSARLMAGGGDHINPLTGREVDYARHVHDGTSHVPARPFLLQAVLAEKHATGREILHRAAGVSL
ncbi:MAG: hypothetical protein NWE89_01225 [Candidatus Bathyarchaeota archaeon]|nr:hypothetical protein [Candidatus Bathyarchaeota archaeon]